jgi:hypothetical protein
MDGSGDGECCFFDFFVILSSNFVWIGGWTVCWPPLLWARLRLAFAARQAAQKQEVAQIAFDVRAFVGALTAAWLLTSPISAPWIDFGGMQK